MSRRPSKCDSSRGWLTVAPRDPILGAGLAHDEAVLGRTARVAARVDDQRAAFGERRLAATERMRAEERRRRVAKDPPARVEAVLLEAVCARRDRHAVLSFPRPSRRQTGVIVCPATTATEFELLRTQLLPAAPDRVFAFFTEARNLESITPPWLRFRIVEAPERLARGSTLRYRLRLFGLPIRLADRDRRGAGAALVHRRPGRRPVSALDPHAPLPRRPGRHGGVRPRALPRAGRAARARTCSGCFVGPWLDEIFDYRRERLEELFRVGSSTEKDPPVAT